jgi:RNA-directed DNA polymerase
MKNGRGKSDRSIEPAKSPNNAEGPVAEATEGRELAEGNSTERNALRTQSRESTPSALERVREAGRKDKKQRFTALLHHIYDYDVERLRAAFLAIKRDVATSPGREQILALCPRRTCGVLSCRGAVSPAWCRRGLCR